MPARLVGRHDEVARLEAALDRAAEGGTHAIMMFGEAGVGKTRCLDEFAQAAMRRGAMVLIGRCPAAGPAAYVHVLMGRANWSLTGDSAMALAACEKAIALARLSCSSSKQAAASSVTANAPGRGRRVAPGSVNRRS